MQDINPLTRRARRIAWALSLLALLQIALVTGGIDPVRKWAWSASSGWVNFRPEQGGVIVYADHLEGYAWSENIGWIRLGTHTGGGPHTYANTSADDYGVNRSATGALSGFAWSASAGWVNFAPDGVEVTLDGLTGELDGFAWAENVGWISFSGPGYGVVAVPEDSRVFVPLLAK